jgi:CheY-like chemotaxis protein
MKNTNPTKPKLQLLIVEDSDADATLMFKSLVKYQNLIQYFRVKDGEEAIDYLIKKDPFSDALTPNIIFLDLNLPRISGFEVLKFIRENSMTKLLPVIVFSASEADQDILLAYKLHANAYISKPVDFSEFQRIISTGSDFWFSVVKISNPLSF